MNGVFQLSPRTRYPREFAQPLHDGHFGRLHSKERTEYRAKHEQKKNYTEDGEQRGERFHAGLLGAEKRSIENSSAR